MDRCFSRFGDGNFEAVPGRHVNTINVMRAVCVVCDRELGSEGAAVAVGFPYCALVHQLCLPFFDFDNLWPHPKPAVAYVRRGL